MYEKDLKNYFNSSYLEKLKIKDYGLKLLRIRFEKEETFLKLRISFNWRRSLIT